jgi:hypothetical protein
MGRNTAKALIHQENYFTACSLARSDFGGVFEIRTLLRASPAFR